MPAMALSDRESRNFWRFSLLSEASDAAQDFFACMIQIQFSSTNQKRQAGFHFDVQNLLHPLLGLGNQLSQTFQSLFV